MSFTDADLRDPHALTRVRQQFERAEFLKLVGIALVDVGPGWAETSLPNRAELGQSEGFIHAGAQATLADHSSGAAAGTLVGADQTVLAVEFKVTLLRPGVGERLTCRAEVIRAGKRLMFTEAKVFGHDAGAKKLVATFSGTVAVVSR